MCQPSTDISGVPNMHETAGAAIPLRFGSLTNWEGMQNLNWVFWEHLQTNSKLCLQMPQGVGSVRSGVHGFSDWLVQSSECWLLSAAPPASLGKIQSVVELSHTVIFTCSESCSGIMHLETPGTVKKVLLVCVCQQWSIQQANYEMASSTCTSRPSLGYP
ncbi:hypothetical protein OPV22_005402 [Ensete ventricosum]|uniref:Uncharacterized protein n=1 Tax=Ensete ventricosum TaxID=4639 RepID=A0AAV8RIE0_ENSVE|nr:hypothetical protein OPV22_005402 [Ensete ventricosum]